MPESLEESLDRYISKVAQRRATRQESRRIKFEYNKNKISQMTYQDSLSLDFHQPAYWESNIYNPSIALKNKKFLAQKISENITNNSYKPHPPEKIPIKKSGGSREISIFGIVDEAVSLLFFKNLLRKNLPYFSNRSYAYRNDRFTYDAIKYITEEFSKKSRIYIAEYDFSKYFDSIDHEYILNILYSGKYHVTETEINLIKSFLSIMPSDKGIPQGTAISLFLANIALSELDREFERIGISFVRFSDDVLIWTESYSDLNSAIQNIFMWSVNSRVNLNPNKSFGVRILTKISDLKSEFTSTDHIEFLSHQISLGDTRISNKSVHNIKNKILRIINFHLLDQISTPTKLQQYKFNNRVDLSPSEPKDKDYISLIWALRKMFYGSVPPAKVRRFDKKGKVYESNLTGFIAYFAACTDSTQVRELDEWVRLSILIALKKRSKILMNYYNLSKDKVPMIWNVKGVSELNKTMIIHSNKSSQPVDITIPSMETYFNLTRKSVTNFGSSVLCLENELRITINKY